ncbi:flagellar FliJ family protein [Desulfitobacterium chlororespirans]|uniref:Flagellar FliJ protein n=1 Tax=Desulfitobacterium chlororespirans DSM 11544 TaxID=1121395 RepID=A0A1M7UDD5_9FIRM|nr:flagellar FliJ family protein [Desulfitobacterium chlororespirans]SHN81019.1 flagellar FliJ protein [Desulfitobacterium chlororespirans DSM 11544]
MAKFRFRLEAALRLAERSLEEQQRLLAQEIQKHLSLQKVCQDQENVWQFALQGQEEACRTSPQDLGLWQSFTQKQIELLRYIAEEVSQQEKVVTQQRQRLLEAHQDTEKLKKLKEKQRAVFNLKEQRREQAVLDEAGQIMFGRRSSL